MAVNAQKNCNAVYNIRGHCHIDWTYKCLFVYIACFFYLIEKFFEFYLNHANMFNRFAIIFKQMHNHFRINRTFVFEWRWHNFKLCLEIEQTRNHSVWRFWLRWMTKTMNRLLNYLFDGKKHKIQQAVRPLIFVLREKPVEISLLFHIARGRSLFVKSHMIVGISIFNQLLTVTQIHVRSSICIVSMR